MVAMQLQSCKWYAAATRQATLRTSGAQEQTMQMHESDRAHTKVLSCGGQSHRSKVASKLGVILCRSRGSFKILGHIIENPSLFNARCFKIAPHKSREVPVVE